ncbi:MAG: transporter substrate-binding domain-containing protein [Cellvibrionaceae bacterium]
MYFNYKYVINLFIMMVFLFSWGAQARSIDEIKSSGNIVVAVKADYKPYGYKNDKGENVGLEIDLAKDVAKRLGVSVSFIDVTSATRMPALVEDKADLMIATMTDKPKRREVVYTVEPPYYSSGTNVLAAKSASLTKWGNIKDKNICGNKGAYYNEFIANSFGAKVTEYAGTNESLQALKDGKCIAYVFDDSLIASRLSEDEWSKDYEMPFNTIDDAPWGLAVKLGQQDLYDFMRKTVIEWHTSGFIIELEKKHGIDPTPFTKKMKDLFKG